jgi:hypothetical protein
LKELGTGISEARSGEEASPRVEPSPGEEASSGEEASLGEEASPDEEASPGEEARSVEETSSHLEASPVVEASRGVEDKEEAAGLIVKAAGERREGVQAGPCRYSVIAGRSMTYCGSLFNLISAVNCF